VVDYTEAEHILNRSSRYSGATNIDLGWTLEVAADPYQVVRAPDLKSRAGYTRLIGYSPTAKFAITVIIDPATGTGVTAWKTRGADLREYLEGKEADS